MNRVLLHPCYFGPISQYVALATAEEVVFEDHDNYQKQTYRNRMYIYGANGKLLLNIPVKHTGDKSQHQRYRDVKIENDFNWQKQHWKSLQNVYRTSAFFEFYEDDIQPLYEKKYKFLLDFNYATLDLALDCLQQELSYVQTEEYILKPQDISDQRFLVQAKRKDPLQFDKYPQVFREKYGFLTDLSIIDLIFNEGPNALNYLENQSLKIE